MADDAPAQTHDPLAAVAADSVATAAGVTFGSETSLNATEVPALLTPTSTVRNGVRTSGKGPRARRAARGDKSAREAKGNAGDSHSASGVVRPAHVVKSDERSCTARVFTGDCRHLLQTVPELSSGSVDLIFADPPFNWSRAYDQWNDALPEEQYLDFTFEWIDLCVRALRPGGALWINIPDDWAAEITCFLKGRLAKKPSSPMSFQNWCVWHYRFGQNTTGRFINSKVHALYFVKPGAPHTWNPTEVVELSDRAAIYGDKRTLTKKDGMPACMRVPMDVWYGKFWGRIQGNNKERRHYHDNQLPEVYLERVIRACSNTGDLVVDPFLGSGTTGVVAHALGRNFIGTEFSEENAKFAAERIRLGTTRPVGLPPGSTPDSASSAIFEARSTLKSPDGDSGASPAKPRDKKNAKTSTKPKASKPNTNKPNTKKLASPRAPRD